LKISELDKIKKTANNSEKQVKKGKIRAKQEMKCNHKTTQLTKGLVS
jgi:hypothetical protein